MKEIFLQINRLNHFPIPKYYINHQTKESVTFMSQGEINKGLRRSQ